MSDSLWAHGLQHARLVYPSPTPGVYSDSCPLSQWCHLTVSSIVEAFTSRLQSFPGSGSFPMNQWPKFWRFSFSISPSNEYSGLISIWIGWLDLLAVQETLKGLLQHHSSKASILWHSAFFTDQLSHPYKTTGKTISPAKSAGSWEINAYHYMPLRLYSCLLLGIYWLIQTTSSFFK